MLVRLLCPPGSRLQTCVFCFRIVLRWQDWIVIQCNLDVHCRPACSSQWLPADRKCSAVWIYLALLWQQCVMQQSPARWTVQSSWLEELVVIECWGNHLVVSADNCGYLPVSWCVDFQTWTPGESPGRTRRTRTPGRRTPYPWQTVTLRTWWRTPSSRRTGGRWPPTRHIFAMASIRRFFCQHLSLFSLVTIWVFEFHLNLSFWVLSQFAFLGFITIWVFEFHHSLSFF